MKGVGLAGEDDLAEFSATLRVRATVAGMTAASWGVAGAEAADGRRQRMAGCGNVDCDGSTSVGSRRRPKERGEFDGNVDSATPAWSMMVGVRRRPSARGCAQAGTTGSRVGSGC